MVGWWVGWLLACLVGYRLVGWLSAESGESGWLVGWLDKWLVEWAGVWLVGFGWLAVVGLVWVDLGGWVVLVVLALSQPQCVQCC